MNQEENSSSEVQEFHDKGGESAVEFVPFGASEKVRLTASIVRKFVAVPSKSGTQPTERDCIRFIMLCRGKRANPFEGDVYMLGYDNWKGDRLASTTFTMVCGVELFLKRAEQSEDFDGLESGVIIKTAKGELEERKGCIVLNDETLVGGWCRVMRKDRKLPYYRTAKLSVYDSGYSRWKSDPAGMIEKVAKSQCLRDAFPTALGGLYSQEEMQRITEIGEGITAEAETRSAGAGFRSSGKQQPSIPEKSEPEEEPAKPLASEKAGKAAPSAPAKSEVAPQEGGGANYGSAAPEKSTPPPQPQGGKHLERLRSALEKATPEERKHIAETFGISDEQSQWEALPASKAGEANVALVKARAARAAS